MGHRSGCGGVPPVRVDARGTGPRLLVAVAGLPGVADPHPRGAAPAGYIA